MSRSFLTRCLLTCMVFGAALSPSLVETQPESTSADARLRALYTEEWNWRRKEMARGGDQPGEAGASDHFPKVDAASQQARLDDRTQTVKTLDSIPFDELSAEEKVNAQIFRTSIRALASDVSYRTYEAPFNSDTFFWTGSRHARVFPLPQRIAPFLGGFVTCPATSTSRWSTCGPGSHAATASHACRSSDVTRRSSCT